ncbi:hypothetical protein L915_19872 [Phytophthora nicotianae]|nr:hypothetical protein L915_19872 [Phytophthora nicotianae]ETL26566.1 hypothetical protein L916_19754 [Phytophthora nicotianae]
MGIADLAIYGKCSHAPPNLPFFTREYGLGVS